MTRTISYLPTRVPTRDSSMDGSRRGESLAGLPAAELSAEDMDAEAARRSRVSPREAVREMDRAGAGALDENRAGSFPAADRDSLSPGERHMYGACSGFPGR